MNIENQIREALAAELQRQLSDGNGDYRPDPDNPDKIALAGRIDLDELTMAVVGSVAGGP
ncbi:hypothetical protein [Chthonobacter albigriseus]|uniref:hypothetical protein n=1 Tax=Chthonobacter albigriseus TaxID=1683161 RepID=UPI0015EF889C|nr:hypothetical protein [Chthonobacter albigriseus]